MKIFIILFLILLMSIFGRSFSQETKNISIIDSLVISSIQKEFDAVNDEQMDSLAIDVSDIEWEKGNYLKILVGNLATKKSFKVFRNYNPTSSFQGLVLTINRFTAGIKYSKPYEKSFLGKNYISRYFRVELRGQFFSARTKEVKKAIEMEINFTDEVLYGNLIKMESSAYSFTKGTREDYSFWEKIYEPVLVVASVGVVVYLFFTQRT